MLKFSSAKILLSVSLLASTALAQAATFTFTQSGFNDGGSVAGFFKANDNDHNGIISGLEVYEFSATVTGGFYDGLVFGEPWDLHGSLQYALVTYKLGTGILGDDSGEFLSVSRSGQLDYNSGSGGGDVTGFVSEPIAHSNQLIYVNELPVPEPDTWAMLVGGLSLLGFAACRKAKRSV